MTRSRNTRQKAKRRKKLTLLKLYVQPVFIIEDGDDREEMVGSGPDGQPLIVSGKDWPGFAKQLEEQRKATEKQLNEADG
jgi:hypothetical protein